MLQRPVPLVLLVPTMAFRHQPLLHYWPLEAEIWAEEAFREHDKHFVDLIAQIDPRIGQACFLIESSFGQLAGCR